MEVTAEPGYRSLVLQLVAELGKQTLKASRAVLCWDLLFTIRDMPAERPTYVLIDIGARATSKCGREKSMFKIKSTELSSLPFPDRLVSGARVWPNPTEPVSNPKLTER